MLFHIFRAGLRFSNGLFPFFLVTELQFSREQIYLIVVKTRNRHNINSCIDAHVVKLVFPYYSNRAVTIKFDETSFFEK